MKTKIITISAIALIIITLANRTTLTLTPTGEGVALTVKEA